MLLKEKVRIAALIALLGLNGCGLGDRGAPLVDDPCASSIDDPACDQDSDGLTNNEEALIGTNPKLSDTDGDGVSDGEDGVNSSMAKDACLPLQATNYVGYNNTNSTWRIDDCDEDGALNGEEDDYTMGSRLSNPYDANN